MMVLCAARRALLHGALGAGCRAGTRWPSSLRPTLILMSVSESEFYEVGMSLPPEVCRHVALRLLESVDPDDAFDHAAEAWLRTEAVTAYERLPQDPSRAVPAEDVRARLNAKWAARS